MPDDVIQRAGSSRSFWKDGPLTQVTFSKCYIVADVA